MSTECVAAETSQFDGAVELDRGAEIGLHLRRAARVTTMSNRHSVAFAGPLLVLAAVMPRRNAREGQTGPAHSPCGETSIRRIATPPFTWR
jgi:hypothetical protein